MRYLPDHGLPLVQLKEQRRDLIVALQNRNGPIGSTSLFFHPAANAIRDLGRESERAAA